MALRAEICIHYRRQRFSQEDKEELTAKAMLEIVKGVLQENILKKENSEVKITIK